MMPLKVSSNRQRGTQNGFASLAVVALLFSLTLLGFVVIAYAQSGYYRATDLYRRLQATYLAEAALNLGAKRMEALIPLNQVELPYIIVPTATMGDGSYSAVLYNNPKDTGGEYDTDDVLVLKATGVAFGQDRRRTIEGVVEVFDIGRLTPPGVLTLSDGATANLGGNTTVSGYDVDESGSGAAGVAMEIPEQSLSASGSVDISGIPDYSWAADTWQEGAGFATLAQRMIEVLASSSAAVEITGNANGQIGTQNAPQITVVPKGEKASLSNSSGYGVLIARGALSISGKFSFRGLILIEGDADVSKMAGTATIEGAIVVTSPSGEPSGKDNLRLAGTNNLLYSQDAISYALDMVPPYRLRSYTAKN